MSIPRTICLLLLYGGTAMLVSGCAARLDSSIETRLDALAQTTAAIASNVNQTRQELSTRVDGIGNQVATVTQNFDPATMHLVIRAVTYLAGGIVLLESAVLISNLWLARCRYRTSCTKEQRK